MDVEKLTQELISSPRQTIIGFLASAIHEATLWGRSAYETSDLDRLAAANELSHILSGHLRDLSDPSAPMTQSRISGVMEALEPLPPSSIGRLKAFLG